MSVTALVILACIPIGAEPPVMAVKNRMQAFVDQGQIAGAVTVIGRGDGVLSHEAVGFQNLEARTPMAKDSLFRIASMTKPITAIGILMLAEEGKLSVDDEVEKHLAEFRGQMLVASRNVETVILKKPSRPITIRDLLTHTSGMERDFPQGLGNVYSERRRTLAEAVIACSQRPLESEPGSKWAYCNPGIDTLGRIIEVISGQAYEEFLRKRIFEPLGMTDTTFFPTTEQLQRLATTYEQKDGRLVPNPFVLIGSPVGAKHPVPAGGLYSTGGDLAKLYRMLLDLGSIGNVRILKPESVAAMTKLQTGDLVCGFVPGMGFGFGVGVVKVPQGVTEHLSAGSFGHGGAFGTQGWIDPVKGAFVVLLIQRWGLENADASPIRRELQALASAIAK
jgi:CubicO group peptidase (beta-lactamase class C family)